MLRGEFPKQYLLLDNSVNKDAIVIPQQDPLQGIVAGPWEKWPAFGE